MTFTSKTITTLGNFYEKNPSNGIDRVTEVIAKTDRFDAGSVNGDFKTPNNYERTRTFQGSFVGYQNTYRASGELFSTKYGVMPLSSYPINLYLCPRDLSLYNTALERMYEQLRGSVDLSIDLLQYKQVRDMSNTLAGSIEKVMRKTRTALSRYGSTKKFAVFAGELWLQWQYGIRPTVSTLHGLIKELNTPQHTAVYCKGTAKAETSDNVNINPVNAGQISFNTLQQRARVEAWFMLNPDVLQDLSRITSLNPVSLGWELLPFSFVFDWIVDIGGYIRSMETAFLHRGTCKMAVASESSKWTTICYKKDVVGNIATDIVQNSFRSAYTRTVMLTAPIPNLPPLKVDLGWQRLVSAASLLAVNIPNGMSKRASDRQLIMAVYRLKDPKR